MAENSHPEAAPGFGQPSSGNTQKAIPDHEGARTSGNDLTCPSTTKAEPNAQQNGSSTPPADAAATAPDTRVYIIPKFSTSTEKEIRTLMNRVRSIQDGSTFTEEDTMKLAALTTNLVEIMNAEYIAKDTIVRAVAYMRGETHLSARRALGQAQRDRRASRRNRNSGNSGQPSQDKIQQSNKGEPQNTGAKPIDDVKSMHPNIGTTDPSPASLKAAALPSDTSHEGKPVGNATNSEKDDTLPVREAQSVNSAAHPAKGKKKRQWRARRQNGRHAADHSEARNGAAAGVENGAMGTDKDDAVAAVKNGKVAPVEVEPESHSNPTDKAKVLESKDNPSHKETNKAFATQA
ncbi:hypothetical protein A1O3_04290 [Capronia epimyces CBS 606.96]|uniref:Uncharacterized protein n=1 Tax=Capronia epimyces CBS 606.96 TaxID=1182542 RepID=W9YDL9_9EURO|nr:uncharacterized protein A1O3_04290 [Capronia epimyces CBS 606.96]EXJ87331.1 hypothetical protein A1O3_04290 [Capronia epimyces CBS 606.96]